MALNFASEKAFATVYRVYRFILTNSGKKGTLRGMITELYSALKQANIPSDMAEKASEAIEKLVAEGNKSWRSEIYVDKIVPIEKENIGIRAEIRILAETLKVGFKAVEKQIEAVEKQIETVEKRVDLLTKLFWLVVGIMATGFSTVITILLKFLVK